MFALKILAAWFAASVAIALIVGRAIKWGTK